MSADALKPLSSVWILSQASNAKITTVPAKWNSGSSEEIDIHNSKTCEHCQVVVAHSLNPITWEAGGSLCLKQAPESPELRREPCLKKQKQKRQPTNQPNKIPWILSYVEKGWFQWWLILRQNTILDLYEWAWSNRVSLKQRSWRRFVMQEEEMWP